MIMISNMILTRCFYLIEILLIGIFYLFGEFHKFPDLLKKLAVMLNIISYVIWVGVFALIMRNFFGGETTIEKNLLGSSNQVNRVSLIIAYIIADVIVSIQKSVEFNAKILEIIAKKKLRAELISLCITYDYNETKLTDLMEAYKEKIELEDEVKLIGAKIDKWKAMFSGQKSDTPVVGDNEHQQYLEREEKKRARKRDEVTERLSMGAGFAPKLVFYFYQACVW
jgi:hypothetical protein